MNKVIFYKGGPAVVETIEENPNFQTVNENGEIDYKEGRYLAICRCGKSKDGLLCDGSHKPKPLI